MLLIESKFFIAAEDTESAMEDAIECICRDITFDRLKKKTTIDNIFQAMGWEVTVKDYDIVDIHYCGDGFELTDMEIFESITPYIKKGSYIRILHEEELWQYFFDGKEMNIKEGVADFNDTSEIVAEILKNKEMLPTLLGIHPSLDRLIGETLGGN